LVDLRKKSSSYFGLFGLMIYGKSAHFPTCRELHVPFQEG